MPTPTRPAVGIDFGTTNTSFAAIGPDGTLQLGRFPCLGALTESYRSLLYFEPAATGSGRDIQCWTGPAGIEHYLEADTKGRLVQSLKSFLSDRTLESTIVFGRRRTVEELIGRLLADVRQQASRQFGREVRSAIVGRPVRFVGSRGTDDDSYAEQRLLQAFRAGGFEDVAFEFEPVAAAHHYEATLDRDELILIGDFGGGTSDFSLVRVGPGVRRRGRTPADLLGNEGVGLAGDAFDAQIIRHLVSPALGLGSSIRSSMGKVLGMPAWPYSHLERWHHLSFLRTTEVIKNLEGLMFESLEPAKIDALLHLVTEDLGYQLHRAVQATKSALSIAPTARFHFVDGPLTIDAVVERCAFEAWIADELGQIEACIDRLLSGTGVAAAEVNTVFLTGGSSFVPAVRRIFETRFGAERLRAGHEFTSVAMGLAWRAAGTT